MYQSCTLPAQNVNIECYQKLWPVISGTGAEEEFRYSENGTGHCSHGPGHTHQKGHVSLCTWYHKMQFHVALSLQYWGKTGLNKQHPAIGKNMCGWSEQNEVRKDPFGSRWRHNGPTRNTPRVKVRYASGTINSGEKKQPNCSQSVVLEARVLLTILSNKKPNLWFFSLPLQGFIDNYSRIFQEEDFSSADSWFLPENEADQQLLSWGGGSYLAELAGFEKEMQLHHPASLKGETCWGIVVLCWLKPYQ